MVSITAFVLEDPGLNPGWFASRIKKKLNFTNKTSLWYSSNYCTNAMGDTIAGGDK